MEEEKVLTERRKYPRISVRENVFIALPNGFHRIGRVKDISLGGLSFEHIYEEISDFIHTKKDILLWLDDLHLPKIPCRIIYDTPLTIQPEYGLLTIQLITRRCGVQFEPLTEEQAEHLISFLRVFTHQSGE